MSDFGLRGLTWAHTRGFAPLAALGRVWEDFHPGEPVTWQSRSLRAFGEDSLDRYLDDHDLLVFDYPFAGEAIAKEWVIPLERLLPPEVVAARGAATIGRLHEALAVDGAQAALALDVATHVAVSRPDLIGDELPSDWTATVALARRTGQVAMPLRPTGVWGGFMTLCAQAGDTPCHRADGRVFHLDLAEKALEQLRELAAHVDPRCFTAYPVALLNDMAMADGIAFMPLTYGYSTYGLRGYGRHRLAFHDIRLGEPVRGAILGGAGIGVSARSPRPHAAAAHAAWLTSPEIQSSLFVQFGGQPANRDAWQCAIADDLTNGFFAATRRSAETAYVRATRPGFHAFQNAAAAALHEAVTGARPPAEALAIVTALWARMGEGSC